MSSARPSGVRLQPLRSAKPTRLDPAARLVIQQEFLHGSRSRAYRREIEPASAMPWIRTPWSTSSSAGESNATVPTLPAAALAIDARHCTGERHRVRALRPDQHRLRDVRRAGRGAGAAGDGPRQPDAGLAGRFLRTTHPVGTGSCGSTTATCGLSTHLPDSPPGTVYGAFLRRRAAYLMSDMAADTAGLVEHLGRGSIHIVGVSMGGCISQTLVLGDPSLARSLTLISTSTGSRRIGHPQPDVVRRMLTRRPAGSRDEAIEQALSMWRRIGSPGYPLERGAGPPAGRCRLRPRVRSVRRQPAARGDPRARRTERLRCSRSRSRPSSCTASPTR